MSDDAKKPNIVITGGSRGIGREFVSQFLDLGYNVISVSRTTDDTKHVTNIPLDLAHPNCGAQLEAALGSRSVDILINNAATFGPRDNTNRIGAIDADAWLEVYRVNVVGTLLITQGALGALRQGGKKTIVFMSSRAGSISERGTLPHHAPGGSYLYRSSKAALNCAVKSLEFDLKPEGFNILTLHPGFIKTDMSGGEGTDSLSDNVAKMVKLITSNARTSSGKFLTFSGEDIPW